LSLDDIPGTAKRKHSTGGQQQLQTSEILEKVIRPERPDDALAYLAFTASDLWPGGEWNYVFGQAKLKDRTGLWSIYRLGDPSEDAEARQLCLQRTLKTAAHETGHILSLLHCTAYQCGMNGVNHRAELDRTPLHFCPICLRKICWNLQVEPRGYLQKLAAFAHQHQLRDEMDWYERVLKKLK
jgi:archaemetzincin